MEKMLATDTENLAGGGEVTAQELLDALAEQVANKLLAKSQVVNNLLATVEGNPLDATQGKALKELIDTTNNNLNNLFANNWITNPNTSKTLFSVVNGWSSDISNVPDDARNTWNSLLTIWIYPTNIGDLTKIRFQALITGNGTVHTRIYENDNFSNWS